MRVGIFEKFRSLGVFVNDTSFFNFSSVDYVKGLNFCKISDINGSDASAPFDGNPNTAWASSDDSGPDPRYIMIHFVRSTIFINAYKYITLCGPSKELTITGSLDGEDFFEIDHAYTNIESNSNKLFRCKHPSYVRYLNITAPGGDRFHVGGFEFYGAFDFPKHTVFCKRRISMIQISLSMMLYYK